jgi:hypothetical protein
VLFTCPSRYSFTIGHTRVFSLGGWSPQLHARLLESGVTQELHYVQFVAFAYRAVTVYGAPFQGTSACFSIRVRGSYNPAATRTSVWALPVSLAATSGISVDFSFHRVLRCFSSPGLPSGLAPGVTAIADSRVSPFGHLGIIACVPLPQAYRSLPRPSSPSCAQASSTCFRSLDYKTVKQSTRDLLE